MKGRKYTAYSIVTTIAEEVAIAAVVLWLLPRFGISIPLWGLVLMMVAWGAYSYVTYRSGKKALDKKPIVSPEAMIGSKCKATTLLAPEGYIRVAGELWRASSSSIVKPGENVVVVGIKGMTLLVSSISNNDHENKRGAYVN